MSLRREDTPSVAAAKASFSTASAYRIESDPRPPSQKQTSRTSRRRDPLDGIFDKEVVPLLVESPALRAVTIFDELCRRYPELPAGVRRWRALHGPEQEVIFAQRNPPGRLGLSDFIATGHLGVTIGGVPLTHLLYHFRLPYSGFEYADVVLGGESFVALSGGCQNALWLLGAVPQEHRTDSLSAAYHNLDQAAADDLTRRYQELCDHYGMRPTRNNRGHTHGTCDVTTRLDEQLRIVFFEGCLQVLDDRLVIAKDLGTVPRGESLAAHSRLLEFTRHLLGASYVLRLARLVAGTQQNYHCPFSYRVVDTVPLTNRDTEFADSATDCLMVPKIPSWT